MFENVVCEMAAILSGAQCANAEESAASNDQITNDHDITELPLKFCILKNSVSIGENETAEKLLWVTATTALHKTKRFSYP